MPPDTRHSMLNSAFCWGERCISGERLAASIGDVCQALAHGNFPRRLALWLGEAKAKLQVAEGIGVSQLLVIAAGEWLVRLVVMAVLKLGECKARVDDWDFLQHYSKIGRINQRVQMMAMEKSVSLRNSVRFHQGFSPVPVRTLTIVVNARPVVVVRCV